MNCNQISNYLIDYIDGKLLEQLSDEVKKHIDACSICQKEYEQTKELFLSIESTSMVAPPLKLEDAFNQILGKEKTVQKNKKGLSGFIDYSKYKSFLQIAAAILLLTSGYIIGLNQSSSDEEDSQITQIQNDMFEMKQMMALNLLENESASQRIKAVSFTEEISNPGMKTIKALINTLENDKNSNVRLAAVYSLSRFKKNELVKDAFIKCLETQEDPMIQIVIINLLVEMEEVNAVQGLKKLLNKKELNEDVKKQAELGLKVLL